jgi:hypothetical protein
LATAVKKKFSQQRIFEKIFPLCTERTLVVAAATQKFGISQTPDVLSVLGVSGCADSESAVKNSQKCLKIPILEKNVLFW